MCYLGCVWVERFCEISNFRLQYEVTKRMAIHVCHASSGYKWRLKIHNGICIRGVGVLDRSVRRLHGGNDVYKIFIRPSRLEEFIEIPHADIVSHALGEIRAHVHMENLDDVAIPRNPTDAVIEKCHCGYAEEMKVMQMGTVQYSRGECK